MLRVKKFKLQRLFAIANETESAEESINFLTFELFKLKFNGSARTVEK